MRVCESVFVCMQVYQTCGTPGEPGTGSPNLHEQRKKSSSLTASEYKPSPTAGLRLEMQVCGCIYSYKHCLQCNFNTQQDFSFMVVVQMWRVSFRGISCGIDFFLHVRRCMIFWINMLLCLHCFFTWRFNHRLLLYILSMTELSVLYMFQHTIDTFKEDFIYIDFIHCGYFWCCLHFEMVLNGIKNYHGFCGIL